MLESVRTNKNAHMCLATEVGTLRRGQVHGFTAASFDLVSVEASSIKGFPLPYKATEMQRVGPSVWFEASFCKREGKK